MKNTRILPLILLTCLVTILSIQTMDQCTTSTSHISKIQNIQQSLYIFLQPDGLSDHLRNLDYDLFTLHLDVRYIMSGIMQVELFDFSKQDPYQMVSFVQHLIMYLNNLIIAIQREPSDVPGVINQELYRIQQELSQVTSLLQQLYDVLKEAWNFPETQS